MPIKMPAIGAMPPRRDQDMSHDARQLAERLRQLETDVDQGAVGGQTGQAADLCGGQRPTVSFAGGGGSRGDGPAGGSKRVGFSFPVSGAGDESKMSDSSYDQDTSSVKTAGGLPPSRGRGGAALRMPRRTPQPQPTLGQVKSEPKITVSLPAEGHSRHVFYGPAAALLKAHAKPQLPPPQRCVKIETKPKEEPVTPAPAAAAAAPMQPSQFSFNVPNVSPPPPPPVWSVAAAPATAAALVSSSGAAAPRCDADDVDMGDSESDVPDALSCPSPFRRLARKFVGADTLPSTDPNINKILHGKLVELGAGEDIMVQQRNPKSPLPPELLKVVYQMGWMRPSKIQETVVPLLLLDPPLSVVAQAQSGTGKTAAFILCMLKRIDPNIKAPQALCVAPTFELARQIFEVVDAMAHKLGNIGVRCVVRQDGQRQAGRPAKVTEQIVVGTPGRTNDFMLKFGVLDATHIKVLVLDEADVMLSTHGHIECTQRLVNAIKTRQSGSGRKLQIAMFSATYDQDVFEFARQLVPDPDERTEVCLRRCELPLENVLQFFVICRDRDAKFDTICALYSSLTIASSIIFCHTRASADWLAVKMTERRHKVAVLHGQMMMEQRYSVIQDFIVAKVKVLITTNLCSRGIDVPHCSVVINYDLPVLVESETDEPSARVQISGPDYDTYIHRIGRTGRFAHPVAPLDPHDQEEMERVDESRRVSIPNY